MKFCMKAKYSVTYLILFWEIRNIAALVQNWKKYAFLVVLWKRFLACPKTNSCWFPKIYFRVYLFKTLILLVSNYTPLYTHMCHCLDSWQHPKLTLTQPIRLELWNTLRYSSSRSYNHCSGHVNWVCCALSCILLMFFMKQLLNFTACIIVKM